MEDQMKQGTYIIGPRKMDEIARSRPRFEGPSVYIAKPPLTRSQAEIKRRRAQAQERVNENKIGVLTFLLVGRAAIHVAVRAEPDHAVREAKRQRLDKMWSDFEGRLLGIIRS